ncbi:MAG: cation:proton antiporter [Victivallales bacterium]|nr:cation:proton antiporter [Victivallales bacterium]
MSSPIFLILFIIFIALITFVPLALRRLGIPGVIALLVVGMVVGPSGCNLVHYLAEWLADWLGGSSEFAEQNFTILIDELGSLGLVFLMALAGMEADFKLIRSARKPVAALSILTFALPAIAGYLVYDFFRPYDFAGKLLYASLFASHSVGIVFPVIRELGLSKTRFGAAVLISTVITDIASIILLAVAVQIRRMQLGTIGVNGGLSIFNALDPKLFGNWFTPIFLLTVILFIGISIYLVNKIGKRMVKRLESNIDLLVTFLLLTILVTVLAGECIGINLIVGAFIAGLALSPLMHKEGIPVAVFYKFEGIGYGLLIPFLFISIGMDTDFSAFVSISNLQIILLTVIGLISSKIFSGWLSLRLTGFRNAEGICAGFMTVPQLSATLAAAAIGKRLEMLDNNFFNAIIILSIVTTLPIPLIVRGIIHHYDLKFEQETKVDAYQVPNATEDADEIL